MSRPGRGRPAGRRFQKSPRAFLQLFWHERPLQPGVAGMGATWWRCKVAPIAIKMEESRREARTRAVAPGAQANGAGAQPSLALATPPNSHGRWRWLCTSSCRTRCRSKVRALAPDRVGRQRDEGVRSECGQFQSPGPIRMPHLTPLQVNFEVVGGEGGVHRSGTDLGPTRGCARFIPPGG